MANARVNYLGCRLVNVKWRSTRPGPIMKVVRRREHKYTKPRLFSPSSCVSRTAPVLASDLRARYTRRAGLAALLSPPKLVCPKKLDASSQQGLIRRGPVRTRKLLGTCRPSTHPTAASAAGQVAIAEGVSACVLTTAPRESRGYGRSRAHDGASVRLSRGHGTGCSSWPCSRRSRLGSS